jgi:hypothetical protein
MKVLNSHLFDLTRDDFASQAAFSSNNFISSKLYLKIMNYAVEAKRLRLFSFNAALLEMISNRLLAESDGPAVHGFDYAGYFEKPLTINNQETKIDVSSYKESFYDPAWGYAFNQNDTEMKLRESSGNFKYTNTALQYLDLYNILNRICLFGKMLAVETGKNITLMTSTGIEGALLSSSLHVNPSFPPKIVIKNLYRMLPQHGLKAHDAERNIEQMVRFAGSLRDETVSEIEKKLFNPLHEGKLQEWAGNLYGYVGNFLDDLNTFRILADSLTNEIDNIKTLIAEVKKSMENLQSKTFQVNPLYEVLSLLCISASSHLKYLGHLMSNTFYGLPIKSDQDRRDLFETTTKIIASVSAYIYELHSGVQYQRDAPDSEKLAFENILLSTYYSLFILSHMAEDAGLGAGTHSLNGAIMFVREKIREESPYLPVAIQTFILLIKILPESLNGSDLTFLLQLINNPGNSSSTYNSICQLLVVAFDSPRIRKIVATAMTLNALVSSKRFIDRASFSQMMYYQGEIREEEFSCWLWTLNLVIHAFKPIKETMGSIDPILSFVKLYMNRILSVLGFQFASLAGQSTFSTPNSDARSRSECFRSTAYIEELDLTMQLMDLLFIE